MSRPSDFSLYTPEAKHSGASHLTGPTAPLAEFESIEEWTGNSYMQSLLLKAVHRIGTFQSQWSLVWVILKEVCFLQKDLTLPLSSDAITCSNTSVNDLLGMKMLQSFVNTEQQLKQSNAIPSAIPCMTFSSFWSERVLNSLVCNTLVRLPLSMYSVTIMNGWKQIPCNITTGTCEHSIQRTRNSPLSCGLILLFGISNSTQHENEVHHYCSFLLAFLQPLLIHCFELLHGNCNIVSDAMDRDFTCSSSPNCSPHFSVTVQWISNLCNCSGAYDPDPILDPKFSSWGSISQLNLLTSCLWLPGTALYCVLPPLAQNCFSTSSGGLAVIGA